MVKHGSYLLDVRPASGLHVALSLLLIPCESHTPSIMFLNKARFYTFSWIFLAHTQMRNIVRLERAILYTQEVGIGDDVTEPQPSVSFAFIRSSMRREPLSGAEVYHFYPLDRRTTKNVKVFDSKQWGSEM